MSLYLLRRLLISAPVLLGISIVLFAILALAPGDPFGELALNPNIPPEVRLNLRQQFGLDDPLVLRYLRWLAAMLRGDWGYSFVSRMPVQLLIMQRLPTTLFVLGSAYVMALMIALPVGILSAVKPYSVFDQIATTLAFIGYSLPTFFTGLLFILVFSISLGWLPFIYSSTIEATGFAWVLEHLRQGAMPITVLGLFEAAALTRFVRASMLEVMPQDFVALQIPTIFTGAVITEQIFRVPGIGSLLIASIESTDTPVVMAITFVYAMLVILFNLIADVVYGFLDPRIAYN